MYVEMQKIVHDDDGAVTPMFNNHMWARSEKIAHSGKPAADMDLDGQRWCERWWLAA
jgi:peptide/nickel transport system substrate-binding protein